MICIADFVLAGNLDGLSIGTERASFLSKLGKPDWWEGMPETDHLHASLWLYGPLQIVFDSLHSAVALAINFDGADNHASHRLFDVDSRLDSKTDLSNFVGFLSEFGVDYVKSTDCARKTIITVTGGATAKFSYRTEYDRSVSEGRQVWSEVPYLVSVRVGEDRFLNSRPEVSPAD